MSSVIFHKYALFLCNSKNYTGGLRNSHVVLKPSRKYIWMILHIRTLPWIYTQSAVLMATLEGKRK